MKKYEGEGKVKKYERTMKKHEGKNSETHLPPPIEALGLEKFLGETRKI